MSGGLFAYIWRNSRREQLIVLAIVLASMPFYFASLDLPRSIVNDAIQGRAFGGGATTATLFHFSLARPVFLGGGLWFEFPGFTATRLQYLLALSCLFLVLVLINGVFKYAINMRKGALGERLLRQLRLDLFSQLLRLKPESIANIKPAEAASIIKDEVEPIGGFVGDAFIQPVFLAGQALTALAFILLQSLSLGLLTGGIVLVQGVVIPRLRREQLRLGKQRQALSRALAGRIGEVVEAMPEVDNHGAAAFERRRVAGMLDQLFWVRYRLYDRKFQVKFINSLLAQVTPFLFYAIGGYYALSGSLDIGQLVAVIAAYRDLPPPVKELIDWDQQRLDVALKYDQVMEQFGAAPDSAAAGAAQPQGGTAGTIELQGLGVTGPTGEPLLENISLLVPAGTHVALNAQSGDGASLLARVIGRRITASGGTLRIGGQASGALQAATQAPGTAFAGSDPIIFAGPLRDNLIYGLHAGEPANATATPGGPASEALVMGPQAGVNVADDCIRDERIINALHIVGLDAVVYRFGLACTLDPARKAGLAGRFVQVRRALGTALAAQGASGLIESFVPERFNRNASIGENLLFGVASGSAFSGDNLARHPVMRQSLNAADLTPQLLDMGRRIAAAMIEIFAGLPGDHFLFEQFSFISPQEIGVAQDMLARAAAGRTGAAAISDNDQLIAFALRYIEQRHRLGFLTPELAKAIVRARAHFRQAMSTQPEVAGQGVEFYDPNRFCAAAPLRDNLLFGRIAHGVGGASHRVLAALHTVLRDAGLEQDVLRLGLGHPAGPGGRQLQPAERRALGLARCLVRAPEILVLDQPLPGFDDGSPASALSRIRSFMAGKTLVAVIRDATIAATFDMVVRIEGARVITSGTGTAPVPAPGTAPPPPGAPAPGNDEIHALRAVPIFAGLDPARLKLIAFTSERLSFAAGDTIFRQGEASDAAYVMLAGSAEAQLASAQGPIPLGRIGTHALIGEMGVINAAPRSASVIALSAVTVLRLPGAVLLSLLAELPQIGLAVMRDQINRTVAAESRLAAVKPSQTPP